VPTDPQSTLKQAAENKLQQEEEIMRLENLVDLSRLASPGYVRCAEVIIGKHFSSVLELCELYKLLPSTVGLFQVIFRKFLV
jgi:hypothetical protein